MKPISEELKALCPSPDGETAVQIIADAYSQIFSALNMVYGLNTDDENFHDTPWRIGKSMVYERCRGINSKNRCVELLGIGFPTNYKGFLVENPIMTNSLCPHHFENVIYKVIFGYIPNDRAVGLSKIARVIDLYARQPILQEDYTKDLADIFENALKPEAMGIVVLGQHNCMIARGIQQPEVWAKTAEVRGSCLTNDSVKNEFYRLANIKTGDM